MSPEVKAINDAIAKKLGLWEEGEGCQGCDRELRYIYEENFAVGVEHPDHNIPAPDLTTAEGHLLLEKTLLAREIEHQQWQASDGYIVVWLTERNPPNRSRVGHSPDPAIALVKAAHTLLVAKE